MTVRDKSSLSTSLSALLVNNTAGSIEADELLQEFVDILDSYGNTSAVSSGIVPMKTGVDGVLQDSSISENANDVDISKNCVFLPAETRFGSTSLRVSGDLFYTSSSRTGLSFFATGTPFTTAGTGAPMSLELSAVSELPETAQQRAVDTNLALTAGQTHEFITPGGVGVDHLLRSFVSRAAVGGSVRLQLFVGNDATGDLVLQMDYDLTTSDQTFVSQSYPRIIDGQNYYSILTAVTNVTLIGTGSGANFRPYQVASGWAYGQVTLATNNNVVDLIEAKTGDDRLDANTLRNLPTGGAAITVEDEGTPLPTAAETLNFTGAGVTATGAGTEKTIEIPGGITGINYQDEGGAVVTATTLNVVGAGAVLSNVGGVATLTITGGTTPGAGPNDFRYGLSQQSDPALVDFGALTDVASPTDPQTVSTGTTSSGDHFHIFSANTHTIQRITDTVLQQDVYVDGGTGNIFTKVANARTESSVTYDAYSVGPLNAGVDENYIVRFT